MAISGFGRGKSGERESEAGSDSGSGNLSAFIDQGSEFEGKLNFKDTVRIDGVFRGDITSENTLLVGETGEIEATIHSQTVVICGLVTGDIHAGRQVVLHKGARIDGDICTPSIVIEDGAVLNGTVTMKTDGAKKGLSPVKDIRPAAGKDEAGQGAGSSEGNRG